MASLDSKDMPKGTRVQPVSSNERRSSPYACKQSYTVGSAKDVKEWDEARCPICMEHPHNAVLLKCSSHEKGCRPFMCNTSCRHSNCFDQFCKSSVPDSSAVLLPEIPLISLRTSEEQSVTGQTSNCRSHLRSELACPFCRGEIFGYIVIQPARQHMNNKVRSCSTEACNFGGTYSELRKHARFEHPSSRPTEFDLTRHLDWIRLESEIEREDIFSYYVQPAEFEPAEGNQVEFNYVQEVETTYEEFHSMRLESEREREEISFLQPVGFEHTEIPLLDSNYLQEVETLYQQLDWTRLEPEREYIYSYVQPSGSEHEEGNQVPLLEYNYMQELETYPRWMRLESERQMEDIFNFVQPAGFEIEESNENQLQELPFFIEYEPSNELDWTRPERESETLDLFGFEQPGFEIEEGNEDRALEFNYLQEVEPSVGDIPAENGAAGLGITLSAPIISRSPFFYKFL